MMKKATKSILSVTGALIVLTALCLSLTACGCRHDWKDTPNAHSQTCALCGEIQLKDEACKWVDATCESPKTCSVCEKTEGERIITDPRFTTAACKDLFGEWKGTMNLTGAQTGIADFNGTMGITYTLTFNPDGTFERNMAFSDKAALLKDLEVYYENLWYATCANMGLNKEQANDYMKTLYGMDVTAWAKETAASIDWNNLFADAASSGVYYVSGGKLCSGQSWSEPIGSDNYTLVDEKLTLESLTQTYPGLEFTRVTK